MIKLIKELFTLLSLSQKKRFYMLQILVVLMAFVEILGVASIIPFMALVGDLSQLKQDTIISQFYQASGMTSELQFIFLLGVGVLFMLFFSAIISVFTIWKFSIFPGMGSGCLEIGVVGEQQVGRGQSICPSTTPDDLGGMGGVIKFLQSVLCRSISFHHFVSAIQRTNSQDWMMKKQNYW